MCARVCSQCNSTGLKNHFRARSQGFQASKQDGPRTPGTKDHRDQGPQGPMIHRGRRQTLFLRRKNENALLIAQPRMILPQVIHSHTHAPPAFLTYLADLATIRTPMARLNKTALRQPPKTTVDLCQSHVRCKVLPLPTGGNT